MYYCNSVSFLHIIYIYYNTYNINEDLINNNIKLEILTGVFDFGLMRFSYINQGHYNNIERNNLSNCFKSIIFNRTFLMRVKVYKKILKKIVNNIFKGSNLVTKNNKPFNFY